METVFEREGVERVEGLLTSVKKNENGQVEATIDNKGTITTLPVGDALLFMAVGRVPNTQNLGLETVGIEVASDGGIVTNARLQTSVKKIYAAGDCTGGPQL